MKKTTSEAIREAIDQVRTEVNAKILDWNKIKSRKLKVGLICFFITLLALKLFTTFLTFDWLASLFK
jgi:hypothetical protein